MKRVFDVIMAVSILLVLSPLFILLIFIVGLALGFPVFFNQKRPGLNGEVFHLIKFRSMTNDCDERGKLLADHLRLNRFSSFLRSTSLDELPSLINVIKGDMSLVGPRPLLEEYLPLYTPEQARRHEIRPGITGWAQVNGRNAISWEEKFKLDVWYVDNQSCWLDIKILLMTVKKVFVREGISADGHATMEKFTGSNK